MSTADVESEEVFGTAVEKATYNKIGGVSFALWGLIHVIVGGIGMAIFFTSGIGPMLDFVHLDAAVNSQAARMSALIVQFYQALLLIGLTSFVLGVTLNWRGEPLGFALNTILVASIETFFIWFEVLPGNRPVSVAVVSMVLLIGGVVFCGLGSLR